MALTKTEVLMEKWNVVKVPLERAGVNIAKLNTLQKASLIAQLETDDMIGENQKAWNEYADGLIDHHPTWATPMFHHRQCAESLLSEYPGNEWDGNTAPTWGELMEAKYAIVWVGNGGDRYTLTCARDKQEVVAQIAREIHSGDEPDYVEAIYDMDTDAKIGDQRELTIITTVTWGDHEYTVGGAE